MKYIIYFDNKYLPYLEYELGAVERLAEGVALYGPSKVDLNELGKYFVKVLNLYGHSEQISPFEVLKRSIFARHFHKVDDIQTTVDLSRFSKHLLPYKNSKIAVRVVYAKDTAFKGLTQELADYLSAEGFVLDIKNPEYVLSIFAGEKLYISVDNISDLPTNYRAGAPHYAEGREISRAEFKLLEAFERFKVEYKKGFKAIDLGASPGGWTHALAGLGIDVVAVDPAELDARVLKNSHVRHYKMPSQDYLKVCKEKFDLIVDDMKMFGDKSAHIVSNCVPLLNCDAHLLMTIKLAQDNLYEQIYNALNILSEHFEILDVKKLFYTRQEIIVFAKKKN